MPQFRSLREGVGWCWCWWCRVAGMGWRRRRAGHRERGREREDERGKTRRVSDWLLGSLITQSGTESRRTLKQCRQWWRLLTSPCLLVSPPCNVDFNKRSLQLSSSDWHQFSRTRTSPDANRLNYESCEADRWWKLGSLSFAFEVISWKKCRNCLRERFWNRWKLKF